MASSATAAARPLPTNVNINVGCRLTHSGDGTLGVKLYSADPNGDAALAKLRDLIRYNDSIRVEVVKQTPGTNGVRELELVVHERGEE